MVMAQWLETQGQGTVLAIGGSLIGLSFGFFAQRSRFCLRAAVIEFWHRQFGQKLSVWLLAFASAVIGVQLMVLLGWLDTGNARQISANGSISGALIGGLLFGLSRKTATEFSFFLAMPTMVGAAVYSGYKYRDLFVPADFPVFAIGFVTAFIFAMIAVRGLLKFIASHSYAAFAWYRIVFGLVILATWQFGWIDWAAAKP